MSEKIKTKEYTQDEMKQITKERDALDSLSKGVSQLVKNNQVTEVEKVGYQKYHEHPQAVAYDLAVAEDAQRQKNAQDKDGAFFAAETKERYEKARISFLKNESWLEPNEAFDKIEAGFNAGLSLQQIMEQKFSPENLAEAFKERPASFCCSDGRVRVIGSEYNKVGMAGGGILMFPRQQGESNADWLERLSADDKFEQLVTELHKLNVKEVLSHEECGAARYVGGKEQGDDDGAILAQYIHLRLQTFGQGEVDTSIAYRHLTLNGDENGEDKMRKEVHDERMLLVDTTGRFNPDALKLPSNFMVSSFKLGMTEDDVEKELEFEMTDLGTRLNEEIKLLVGVAGDHGFKNKRFTKEKPFYIFVVSDSAEHLAALIKCAEDVQKNVDSLPIKVDGFVYSK